MRNNDYQNGNIELALGIIIVMLAIIMFSIIEFNTNILIGFAIVPLAYGLVFGLLFLLPFFLCVLFLITWLKLLLANYTIVGGVYLLSFISVNIFALNNYIEKTENIEKLQTMFASIFVSSIPIFLFLSGLATCYLYPSLVLDEQLFPFANHPIGHIFFGVIVLTLAILVIFGIIILGNKVNKKKIKLENQNN